MTFMDMVMIGIGGFFGAVIRYLISEKLNNQDGFPAGTLLVNLIGALLIGITFGLALPLWAILLLASGFAGALTTFSTMNKELLIMWRNGKKGNAIIYLMLLYVTGIILAFIGYLVGSSVY
ncbi:CrcB family protein [Sporosarcina sp. ANT_H38]|uniref:fluoride efflux transporter FluC n=1 Tax=Sporosarcina sp. ANT_H38 TaxID=2597358 RepID=UPI0011F31D95|nr:CrcB family protein [Sporosarcina sp. ANT_H38]KAA0964815.1 CrcB family protein [Sporosarcina sp. ANT_H38]